MSHSVTIHRWWKIDLDQVQFVFRKERREAIMSVMFPPGQMCDVSAAM